MPRWNTWIKNFFFQTRWPFFNKYIRTLHCKLSPWNYCFRIVIGWNTNFCEGITCLLKIFHTKFEPVKSSKKYLYIGSLAAAKYNFNLYLPFIARTSNQCLLLPAISINTFTASEITHVTNNLKTDKVISAASNKRWLERLENGVPYLPISNLRPWIHRILTVHQCKTREVCGSWDLSQPDSKNQVANYFHKFLIDNFRLIITTYNVGKSGTAEVYQIHPRMEQLKHLTNF